MEYLVSYPSFKPYLVTRQNLTHDYIIVPEP
jgi:hypothetical protein